MADANVTDVNTNSKEVDSTAQATFDSQLLKNIKAEISAGSVYLDQSKAKAPGKESEGYILQGGTAFTTDVSLSTEAQAGDLNLKLKGKAGVVGLPGDMGHPYEGSASLAGQQDRNWSEAKNAWVKDATSVDAVTPMLKSLNVTLTAPIDKDVYLSAGGGEFESLPTASKLSQPGVPDYVQISSTGGAYPGNKGKDSYLGGYFGVGDNADPAKSSWNFRGGYFPLNRQGNSSEFYSSGQIEGVQGGDSGGFWSATAEMRPQPNTTYGMSVMGDSTWQRVEAGAQHREQLDANWSALTYGRAAIDHTTENLAGKSNAGFVYSGSIGGGVVYADKYTGVNASVVATGAIASGGAGSAGMGAKALNMEVSPCKTAAWQQPDLAPGECVALQGNFSMPVAFPGAAPSAVKESPKIEFMTKLSHQHVSATNVDIDAVSAKLDLTVPLGKDFGGASIVAGVGYGIEQASGLYGTTSGNRANASLGISIPFDDLGR